MANCQNNMRYGRQMNGNSGRRGMNMPSDSNPCRDEKLNTRQDNRQCEMPGRDNDRRCEPARDNSRQCEMPAKDRGRQCESTRDSGRQCESTRDNNRRCEPARDNRRQCETTEKEAECDCERRERREERRRENIDDFPIAMAYVPWQMWRDLYEAPKALQCGTVFGELYKPFLGRGGCNR